MTKNAPLVGVIGAVVILGATALLLFTSASATSPLDGLDQADRVAVQMAAEVLTMPDTNPGYGRTLRWDQDVVTYSVDAGVTGAQLEAVRGAGMLVSDVTGLSVVEVAEGGDIEVTALAPEYTSAGSVVLGEALVTTDASGAIVSAAVNIGCCDIGTVYEEMFHAFGPLGDRADSRSMFTNTGDARTPSEFDLWLTAALYEIEVGADFDAVSSALALSLEN